KEIVEQKLYDPEGVKARNELAKISFEEGDFGSTKKYINKVLEEYPNNNDALLIRGRMALSAFDAISAINDFRTVVKNDPESDEATLLLAKAYEINHEPILAKAELKRAIEAAPVNYKTHYNYALYLAKKKDLEDASNVVNKALLYFKGNFELLSLKLKLLPPSTDKSVVLNILNDMKIAAPNRFEVYLSKGQYYLAIKDYKNALLEFELALSKTSNKYIVLDKIVKTYFLQKRADLAFQKLNDRLKKDENDSAALQLFGQIYLSRDMEKARNYLNRAISSAETWEAPYTTLAASYLMEKNQYEALKVFQLAAGKVNNKTKMLLKVASLYEVLGKHQDAIRVYEKVLKRNSNHKLAANNLASLYLDYGSSSDIKKAVELTKDFKKMNRPAFTDTLAWASTKSGDNLKAIELLLPLIEKSPEIAVFQYHLAFAFYNNNEKSKAKKYFESSASSKQEFVGKSGIKKILNEL
ncbi:MAG: tetratricopeptide repeat protein, partial [Methylococcales bacterium]